MPGLKHSPVILQRLSGGTTVSATMIAAHRAGIHVFVTGGIGGVHRDGENSEQTGDQRTASHHWISIKNPDFFLTALDISADLTELGRTPVAVVSAGVKSILDIGRTLEFLVRSLENSQL